ncbi:MAG: CvpA family protein [bacterium]
MTWLDWTIAAVVLFAALQGFRRGTLVTLVSAIGVIVAYLAASVWYRPLTGIVQQYLRFSGPWAATIAFVAPLIAIYIVIGVAITAMAGAAKLSPASRLVGTLMGMLKGALLAVALLIAAMGSPIGLPIKRDAERSPLAAYAIQAHRIGATALDTVLPDAIRPFGLSDEKF